jgi:hypothetical protein
MYNVYAYTRWFKYDRDCLCVNKSQFVPVIFEPPCTLAYDTFVKKNSSVNILQLLIISAHGLLYGLKMARIKGRNM